MRLTIYLLLLPVVAVFIVFILFLFFVFVFSRFVLLCIAVA